MPTTEEQEGVDRGYLETLEGCRITAAYTGDGGFHIDLDNGETIIVILGAIVTYSNTRLQ